MTFGFIQSLSNRVAPFIWQAMNNRLERTHAAKVQADADVEFHTMLGERDLIAYIIAIKSLLRYLRKVRVGVVIHSDGTLSDTAINRLQRHIPGILVVDPIVADERCRRECGSESFVFRQRSVYLSWKRLIDTQLWRRTEKIVNVDADILCLNRPTELIKWIEGGTNPILIGQTNGQSTPEKLTGQAWHTSNGTCPNKLLNVQTRFLDELPEISAAMKLPLRFLDGACAGLHGHMQELNLQNVEKLIKKCQHLGLTMREWGSEQCTVVYLLSAHGANRLDPQYYFNFFPDCLNRVSEAAIIHFVGLSRYHRWLYPKLAARVLNELSRE